jgi:hypothetical protein
VPDLVDVEPSVLMERLGRATAHIELDVGLVSTAVEAERCGRTSNRTLALSVYGRSMKARAC